MWKYHFLDYFFICFHFSLILFNLFGWIWKRSRKMNLLFLMLTAVSWFGLGIFYGIGFCPLTEWHWQVMAKLGSRPQETSYLQMLVRRLSGVRLDSSLVDAITLYCFFAAIGVSAIINARDWRRKMKQRNRSNHPDK
jgi:hypothetical protein